MARTPQDVTAAELAVLEVLWDKGPSSRRQLADVLYPDDGPAHYTTVQKLLQRLEGKGFVTSHEGPVRTFAATLSRDELIRQRLQRVADSLCDGSLTPLLMHLVQDRRLSDQEVEQLRDLIRQHTRRKGS
jgi:predicted transcriptional regulator